MFPRPRISEYQELSSDLASPSFKDDPKNAPKGATIESDDSKSYYDTLPSSGAAWWSAVVGYPLTTPWIMFDLAGWIPCARWSSNLVLEWLPWKFLWQTSHVLSLKLGFGVDWFSHIVSIGISDSSFFTMDDRSICQRINWRIREMGFTYWQHLDSKMALAQILDCF